MVSGTKISFRPVYLHAINNALFAAADQSYVGVETTSIPINSPSKL